MVQAGGDETTPLAFDQSLDLHASDGGEWTLRSDGATLQMTPQHEKSTAAVRGDAVSLLLAMARRIPADDPRITVFGDDEVRRSWLDRTPF